MTIRLAAAGVRHPHIDTILHEADARSDVDLVGIAERFEPLRREYASRYNAPGYQDLDQLLDASDVDVIAIGDVFGNRGQLVVQALRAGAHVLADKPLCTTRADLDAIHAAYRECSRQLSVAFEKRFYAPTLAVTELLAAGELGELALVTATGPHKLTREQRPEWMFTAETYGGILNDLIVHDIDLFLQFSGARQGSITGHAGNFGNIDRPDFEDTGLATINSSHGPIASLDAHWMSPEAAPYHGDYKMRLVGTKGTADLLWKDNELIVGTHRRAPTSIATPPPRRAAADFFDALLNGASPLVTAADALAATSIALAAQESAHHGRQLTWDVTAFGSDTAHPAQRRP